MKKQLSANYYYVLKALHLSMCYILKHTFYQILYWKWSKKKQRVKYSGMQMKEGIAITSTNKLTEK